MSTHLNWFLFEEVYCDIPEILAQVRRKEEGRGEREGRGGEGRGGGGGKRGGDEMGEVLT